jgi:hypothetical protein
MKQVEAFELMIRPLPPTVDRYVRSVSWDAWQEFKWEGVDLLQLEEKLLSSLPTQHGEGVEHFTDDVLELCNWGKTEHPCKKLSVSLRPVTHDACRFFHTDRNFLRLLCTYIGPGTEVIPEHNVRREGLTQQNNTLALLDFSRVKRLKSGDAVLLKGDLHPQHLGRGAVHRSPEIQTQGERRLVLKIDFH